MVGCQHDDQLWRSGRGAIAGCQWHPTQQCHPEKTSRKAALSFLQTLHCSVTQNYCFCYLGSMLINIIFWEMLIMLWGKFCGTFFSELFPAFFGRILDFFFFSPEPFVFLWDSDFSWFLIFPHEFLANAQPGGQAARKPYDILDPVSYWAAWH